MTTTSKNQSAAKGKKAEETKPSLIDLSSDELESFRDECVELLPAHLAEILSALVRTHIKVVRLLESSRVGVRTLRKLIFGPKTEKTSKVIGKEKNDQSDSDGPDGDSRGDAPRRKVKRKGHGRRKASEQTGATDVFVPCTKVTPKQRCPLCQLGKIYLLKDDGVVLRFAGQPPIAATRYNIQRCRCQLCGEVFAAQLPPEAGDKRYDETVRARPRS